MPAEEVRKVIHEYFERLLKQRDLTVCDELLATGYLDRDTGDGVQPGREETKSFVSGFLATYPDLRVEVQDVVVEGERAAVRLQWTGTHGETGEVLDRQGIIILRLDEDGQIAERWSAYR